jgi:hypothetical protein
MESKSPLEELDSCDYLYLNSISEPEPNTLCLIFSEGIVSDCAETIVIGDAEIPNVRPIEVTATSRHFEVVWDSYISYAVRNESYEFWDKEEEWVGNSFRVYSKSKFLDFIASGTSASDIYPGPFVHYEILCSDHIIDVASEHQPTVRLLGA